MEFVPSKAGKTVIRAIPSGEVLKINDIWSFLSFKGTPLSMSEICWRRFASEQAVALVPWSEH
jgi:hypothetical protein